MPKGEFTVARLNLKQGLTDFQLLDGQPIAQRPAGMSGNEQWRDVARAGRDIIAAQIAAGADLNAAPSPEDARVDRIMNAAPRRTQPRSYADRLQRAQDIATTPVPTTKKAVERPSSRNSPESQMFARRLVGQVRWQGQA